MNVSDIMAEAALSIEKSCLVAHAFEYNLYWTIFKKWKEKSSDAASSVLYESHRQIHVSETTICLYSK